MQADPAVNVHVVKLYIKLCNAKREEGDSKGAIEACSQAVNRDQGNAEAVTVSSRSFLCFNRLWSMCYSVVKTRRSKTLCWYVRVSSTSLCADQGFF